MSEVTLLLIKPDAYAHTDKILVALGVLLAETSLKPLRLVCRTVRTLTPNQVRDLYAEALDSLPKEYGEEMVRFMTGGPSLIVLLKGEDAVARVRAACGPTNPREAVGRIRWFFGDRSPGAPIYRNAVHASDSPDAARREAFALLPEDWAYFF